MKDGYEKVFYCQNVFLISPFLYRKEMLGKYADFANFNPLYLIVSNVRDSFISGNLYLTKFVLIFLINIFGTYLSVYMLRKSRKVLPFLI